MKAIKWIGIVVIAFIILFISVSMTLGTQPDSGFMSERMAEIESHLPYRDVSNADVSSVDIAWQLDHILKAIISITQALEDSDPEDYSFNFNAARTFVFTAGDFPRGVAKAPASVIPPDNITNEALINQLEIAREKLNLLPELDTKSSMIHDTFGQLDRNEAARLIEVHTDHHLKIIRDILIAEGMVRD